MNRQFRSCGLAVLAGALLLGCGDNGTGPSGSDATIQATTTLTFTPASLTVAMGKSVTFAFGSTAHTVVFDAVTGKPDDIPASSSKSVARTFNTPGDFPYHCSIHSGMSGTVHVTPGLD
jgi:plastocyanin